MFGRERILSAPAYKVCELSRDAICVQLSKELSDMTVRYEEVEAVRRDVKRHLGEDAFFDPIKGEGYRYSVPQFEFVD